MRARTLDWRIGLSQPQAGMLPMRHFNITPDGQEEITARADFGRGGAA
jgi:hypothetical protein